MNTYFVASLPLNPIWCVTWIVIGSLAGSIANSLTGVTGCSRFVGNVIMGLIGSALGGVALALFSGARGFSITGLFDNTFASAVGAFGLIILWRVALALRTTQSV